MMEELDGERDRPPAPILDSREPAAEQPERRQVDDLVALLHGGAEHVRLEDVPARLEDAHREPEPAQPVKPVCAR